MKLSRKQVIYGLVLGAAAIAWVIDASFFGPPAAARATQPAPDGATGQSVKTTAAETGETDSPEHLLTGRLENWAVHHPSLVGQLPDVFQVPAVAKPVLIVPVPQAPEDPALVFARQHRLIAIVLNADGGYALVDGRVLRIGQSIDGVELIGLTRRAARFAATDRTFDVPLTSDVPVDH